MKMDEIKDMINQLVDGNTEQAQQAFDAAISLKVVDALDSLKMDVAQNLYK
jgi:hypothetical protein